MTWKKRNRVWECVSLTDTHRIERLDAKCGEWTISQTLGKYESEAKIKFRTYFPEGWDYHRYKDEMDKLDEEGKKWSPEHARIHNYMSANDIGYAKNFFEAKILVDYLMRGTDGLPSTTELLEQLGFKDAYSQKDREKWNITHETYTHATKKNLQIMCAHSFHLVYNVRNGWDNMVRLQHDHANHDGSHMITIIYPAHIQGLDDLMRIGLAYTREIMDRRSARGGLFKKPLEA